MFMKYYSDIFEITLVFYLPVLDGEVGEELEEHEPAVDVFVVGAVARPRSAVHDEQLQHFPCNLAKTLALYPCQRKTQGFKE